MLADEIKNAKILVVDDEPVNILLLQRFLDKAAYTHVDTESDARNVVQRYLDNDYDLVLLDINMPYISGIDILRELVDIERQRDSLATVLVLTAQVDSDTRFNALEYGARDFINKPFDSIEVLQRIRNLLEVSLLNKQVRQQNQLLEEQVRERTMQLQLKNRELEDTRLEIIRRLGRAAEYRDNETGLHIMRMSNYSHVLAKAAGLSDEKAGLLLNASPMHDIGKLGISDEILLKQEKLTPQEWEIMKTHVTIGVEILSGHHSELMEMARIVALTHHEKWDGSGYPYGLKGEKIPLVGRIVALADVFDALTSIRPYKKAWPVEQALTEIEAQSGRHFDPQLVSLFKQNLSQILRIKEQYAEPERHIA